MLIRDYRGRLSSSVLEQGGLNASAAPLVVSRVATVDCEGAWEVIARVFDCGVEHCVTLTTPSNTRGFLLFASFAR